ncbi:hypothetical protein R0R95_004632 [Salmonella enterica]|nr:hypothetical protein [Salmonella enterica]
MREKEKFQKLFKLDDNSPTGLALIRNGKPAGYKQPEKRNDSYSWVVKHDFCTDTGRKQIRWSLPLVLWELRTGEELSRSQMISYVDGNKNNLAPYNLTAERFSIERKQEFKNIAYDNYRNIVLPKLNPDYFKDPKDWTDPEALELLNKEKQRRAAGEGKTRNRIGRLRKWS